MMKLNTQIRKDFIDKIEEALALTTSNLASKFSLYDIWEYNNVKDPITHQNLYRYFEKLFYNDLNVIGGAFSVLEKFSNVPLLLFRKDRNHSKDVIDSDFFWMPYEVKYYNKEAATLIDTTFLSTRESQRLDESGPDFLRYINGILKGETYQLSKLTNGMTMHNALPFIYCDSAEIIIFCLFYIIIIEKYQDSNSCSTQIFSEKHIESFSFDSKEGKGVLNFILKKHSKSFFNLFLEQIGKLPLIFFERIDKSHNSTNEEIKAALEVLIENDLKINNFSNYDDCLAQIHKHARFPIIPYLLIYWYKGEREQNLQTPIFPCHLVFPVWNSYSFQPKIKLDKELISESKVIFALLTVNDFFYFNTEDGSSDNFSILSRIIHKLGYITSDTVFYNKFAKKSVEKPALQSAISQVFARNFAHNIGSHVAIRATNRMAKERIANLYEWRKADKKLDIDKINNPKVINWLDHMSEKLDLFEVARNEFLAEYSLPAKNVQFYRDVILPFCENTLLMDNIAYSEGINYQTNCTNRLKIVTKLNGTEIKALYPLLKSHGSCNKIIKYPDTFPYLVEPINESITMEEAFNKKDIIDESGSAAEDIEICLTSEHTLYSILENLIRNSAKHNKDKLQKRELIIAIDILDESDDYYCIQVSDNVSAIRPSQLKEFEDSLKTSLIGPDGEIEKKSLGIADMKINAQLLKTDTSITQQNLGDSIQLIYLAENGEVKPYTNATILDEGKKYNFGYQFKLCKPKKVIWIGKEDEAKKYGSKGIVCCLDYKKFKPDNNYSKAEDQPLASYQFAILELEAVMDLTNNSKDPKRLYEWDDFLMKLPHRVLLNCTEDEYKKIKNKIDFEWINELKEDGRIQFVNPKIKLPTESEMSEKKDWDFEFLRICWENWLKRWDISADKKGRLIIYFEDESVAETWNKFKIGNVLVDIDFLSNQIDDFIPINDGIKVAIYDHHASGYNGLVSKNKITNTPSEFIKNRSWIQFDKTSNDFIRFFYPSKDENSNHLFLLEAFDAAMSRIVVLDERIAELLTINNANTKNIRKEDGFNSAKDEVGDYADLANNGNVFLITHLQDNSILNNEIVNFKLKFEEIPTLELVTGRNITLPNRSDADTSFTLDALIIHRTYLLELFKSKSDLELKGIMHLLYKKFKRVVVVSGGGYPHSIVGFKVYFKTYSNLKSSFNLYPSKLSLNNLI